MMLKKRPIFTNKSNNRGFTLLELMVVIAIVGVVASIAIRSFNVTRANVLDAAALAETRSLGTVIVNAFIDGASVNLAHDPGDGAKIGTLDAAGNARSPIFTLSNGLLADISGTSDWGGTGFGVCSAEVWYPGHPQSYWLVIDETTDPPTFLFPIN